tara:strand:+ start:276 stop:1007 length:732 start_codon:yes stop_codon:yes gene_type:complete
MAETISYSTTVKGWNSFHSYIPDWMIGINSSLYTWKYGQLYKHNTNSVRNNYYGDQFSSTITPIFNQDLTYNKVYKTLALWSNIAWRADITTDFTTGIVEPDFFKLKEGEYYAHIRRPEDTVDLKAISTQGIGVGSYNSLVFTFANPIPSSVMVGDDIYVSADPGNVALQKVGSIASLTATTVTVSSAAVTPNANGDFIVAVKNSQAESYGARGSYMEVKLTSTSTDSVELFTVSSDAMRSYP